MSKQDRQGVRTASDLERKYDLASLVGIKQAVQNSVEGINKTNKTLEEFVTSTLNSIVEIQEQLDGNITAWFYKGVPTLSNLPASEWTTEDLKKKHLSDLYYDQNTGYSYRFMYDDDEYFWKMLLDNDIAEVLAIANSAQDTADSKRRVFVAQPTTPYDSGDLWFKQNEIYICQISKDKNEVYEDKDFIIATKYTDDTLAKQVGDNLEIVRGTVTTIQEGVDAFKIEMETTVKSIDSLQQETIENIEKMSYTFGTHDLHIAKSTDSVNTRINNQGLKVYNFAELNAIFNHKGAGVNKLIVVGDAQLGNVSVVRTKDENDNDCTDFNYLVSDVQTLRDLEGD